MVWVGGLGVGVASGGRGGVGGRESQVCEV